MCRLLNIKCVHLKSRIQYTLRYIDKESRIELNNKLKMAKKRNVSAWKVWSLRYSKPNSRKSSKTIPLDEESRNVFIKKRLLLVGH